MKNIAIYPGTFDPPTNGHLDIVKKGSQMFNKIYVAVSLNTPKNPMYSVEDRVFMLKLATKDIPNVEVIDFSGLLVTCAKKYDASIIVRGLRAASDFEYEFQMGYANASLDSSIETIFLMPSLKHTFISSSIVRSVILHNGSISHLVPHEIEEFIMRQK